MTGLDISEITGFLYVSTWPRAEHARLLRELGVELILSMYLRKPDKTLGEPPISLLWLPYIDSPITPTPLAIFHRGVGAALPVIDGGGKVLVHCKWGIHRSPAMACCILIAKGHTLEEALKLVKSQRAVARPDDGYVLARIKKFEEDWKRRKRETSPVEGILDPKE